MEFGYSRDIKTHPVTQEEMNLYFYLLGRSGSFITNLFKLISVCDYQNKDKMKLAFPKYVEVWEQYKTVEGYWSWITDQLDNSNIDYL